MAPFQLHRSGLSHVRSESNGDQFIGRKARVAASDQFDLPYNGAASAAVSESRHSHQPYYADLTDPCPLPAPMGCAGRIGLAALVGGNLPVARPMDRHSVA